MDNAFPKEARIDVLADELDRVRACIAEHEATRFRVMNWGALVMLVLLIFAYTPMSLDRLSFSMAALALPFVAIYLLMQYAYMTNLTMYERTHASGLESRINAECGEDLLITEFLATAHVTPTGKAGFLGIGAGNIRNMFSATTVHFLVVCLAMFLGGLLRSNFLLQRELAPVEKLGQVYVPLLFLWAIINVGYLVWYFLTADHQRAVQTAVSSRLEKKD